MAFVILSAGTLTRSRTHTISSRLFLWFVAVVMLAVAAGGFLLGYGIGGEPPVVGEMEISVDGVSERAGSGALGSSAPAAGERGFEAGPVHSPVALEAEEASDTTSSDHRLLIDRFGELSGRMIQLEVEAGQLAAKIGAIKEFEARVKSEAVTGAAKGRTAKTPPGRSEGGPLLRPTDDASGALLPSESPEPGSTESLSDELVRMEEGIHRLADALAELDRITTSLNLAHMSFPGRTPVRGARLGSKFGNRLDPFTKRRAFHSGVDFPAPRGTPIYASAGGRVIYAAFRRDYGHTVEIDHGAGLVTRYAHSSKLLVKSGQIVVPGEKIALIGSTGRSSGPHLHFEILQDGRFADPAAYLAQF